MCFPGGETFRAAQQRVTAALEEIAAQYEEKDLVACFSHSDSIRLAVTHFLSMPLDVFQRVGIDTASITTLVLNKGQVYLANMNFLPGWAWPKPEEKKPEKQPKVHA
jgi:probable phosphoglycerate mutase